MEQVASVLTGDVISSTAIDEDYSIHLRQIFADLSNQQSNTLVFDIYRGDSFQLFVSDIYKSFEMALLIRIGLRRNSYGQGVDDNWDSRISIGIGKVDQFPDSDTKIGSMNGEAFVFSGRSLDQMKSQHQQLAITTDDTRLNQQLNAFCALVDALVGRWSTQQAEAIYLYLLEKLTQEQVGERLGVSQKAISKRLESAQYSHILPFLTYFQDLIKWKYSI